MTASQVRSYKTAETELRELRQKLSELESAAQAARDYLMVKKGLVESFDGLDAEEKNLRGWLEIVGFGFVEG